MKKTPRKMPQNAVEAAMADCARLMELARNKVKSRPQLSKTLVSLSGQALVTLSTANTEFPKETVGFAKTMLEKHVDVLLELDSKFDSGTTNPARKELCALYRSIKSKVGSEELEAYNPLSLKHLAESTHVKFNEQPVKRLSEIEPFQGAGVYALYYMGGFPLYEPIATANRAKQGSKPIYVGEAGRQGKRKGIDLEDNSAFAIYTRLHKHHTKSIEQAKSTLELQDFWFRYLAIESLFVPLCESILIQTHDPLWNRLADGFGNKEVGSPREREQQITAWDLLHPGRAKRATKPNKRFPTSASLQEQVTKFLSGSREGVDLLPIADAVAAGGGVQTDSE